jgi:hypothetical protein
MNKAALLSLFESRFGSSIVRHISLPCTYSQGRKKRIHGTDAVKAHILAAKTVADLVKTSLVRAAKPTFAVICD